MSKQLAKLFTLWMMMLMLSGCTQGASHTFSTEGHPKAQGLEIKLKYPSAWRAQESDRPHIVQKFVSPGGAGDGHCTLIVGRPRSQLSAAYISHVLSERGFNEYVPEGARFISGSATSWDSLPAVMVDVKMHHEQLGTKVVQYLRTYNTIYRDLYVQLHCGVGAVEDSSDLFDAFRRHSTSTFQLIANSVVFVSNWKDRKG